MHAITLIITGEGFQLQVTCLPAQGHVLCASIKLQMQYTIMPQQKQKNMNPDYLPWLKIKTPHQQTLILCFDC